MAPDNLYTNDQEVHLTHVEDTKSDDVPGFDLFSELSLEFRRLICKFTALQGKL